MQDEGHAGFEQRGTSLVSFFGKAEKVTNIPSEARQTVDELLKQSSGHTALFCVVGNEL